jgi:hypothetical protein
VRIGLTERQVALEPQLEQALAQEHEDLGGGFDAQLRGQAEFDRMVAHEAIAERVEGRDRRTDEAVRHQLVDARLHLGGGLVGEREREDLLRAGLLARNEPSDALRDDLRLPGARARDDHERALAMRRRLPLLRMQLVQTEQFGRGGGVGAEVMAAR